MFDVFDAFDAFDAFDVLDANISVDEQSGEFHGTSAVGPSCVGPDRELPTVGS